MTTRDTQRSNGGRYRNQNDRELTHIREHDSAPEWGNRFTCVACWQHNITDIVRHRSQHCEDWNALNRINCGFHRQWTEGRASLDASGSYPTKPYILKGEHYRMVKGRYGVQPHHIMRWQDENFGPYDPLIVPQGCQAVWQGFTYFQLLLETIQSLPPSMHIEPRICSCTRALLRSRNGATHSYFNEKNSLDELADQAAIGNFMAAHPPLVGHYQNLTNTNWNHTQPRMARNSFQPLNGQGVWVPLAPQGQGVCQQGSAGISESIVAHCLQYQVAVTNGQPFARMNLYTGRSIADARRGHFSMPGTPGR